LSHVLENWVACAFIWFFITHTMAQSSVVTSTMCYDFSPAEGGVGKPRRDAPELISLMSTCVLVDLQNLHACYSVSTFVLAVPWQSHAPSLSWQCLGVCRPLSWQCLGSVLTVSWQDEAFTRRRSMTYICVYLVRCLRTLYCGVRLAA
jgi:hypothetical protein